MNSVKFGSIWLTTSIPMELPKSIFFAMGLSGFGFRIWGLTMAQNEMC